VNSVLAERLAEERMVRNGYLPAKQVKQDNPSDAQRTGFKKLEVENLQEKGREFERRYDW